jgi:hypothetical protein
MIKDHFLHEVEPEMKKMVFLKKFLEDSKEANVKKNYNNKKIQDSVYLAISKDESEEFLKDFKPDHKKLALFQIFLNDRILKLEDLSKRFLKSLMPNFL